MTPAIFGNGAAGTGAGAWATVCRAISSWATREGLAGSGLAVSPIARASRGSISPRLKPPPVAAMMTSSDGTTTM